MVQACGCCVAHVNVVGSIPAAGNFVDTWQFSHFLNQPRNHQKRKPAVLRPVKTQFGYLQVQAGGCQPSACNHMSLNTLQWMGRQGCNMAQQQKMPVQVKKVGVQKCPLSHLFPNSSSESSPFFGAKVGVLSHHFRNFDWETQGGEGRTTCPTLFGSPHHMYTARGLGTRVGCKRGGGGYETTFAPMPLSHPPQG